MSKLIGEVLTHSQQQELSNAVNGVMALDKPLRRLSRCLEFIDPVEENGCHARLQKWCDNGQLAWVLDNPIDELDITHQTLLAFDVSEFLDHAEVRTPIVMYLFHRIEKLIDGRRLQIIMDEFWKLGISQFIRYQFKFQRFICYTCESRYKATFCKINQRNRTPAVAGVTAYLV